MENDNAQGTVPARIVRLVVQYDGTDFHGFQKQNNGLRTVQGEIEKALYSLLGRKTKTVGASRTDKGVHALGQTVSFETTGPVPPERIADALRPLLPRDIATAESVEAPKGFSARFDATAKTYRYVCYRNRWQVPLLRNLAIKVPSSFDEKIAAEVGRMFVGTHNFAAFANQGSTPRDPFKTIYSFEIDTEPPFIKFNVSGAGFLYKQVRNMVGTAIEAGLGKKTPGDIEEALRTGRRELGGTTMPPQGLYLMKVHYSECATKFQNPCIFR